LALKNGFFALKSGFWGAVKRYSQNFCELLSKIGKIGVRYLGVKRDILAF